MGPREKYATINPVPDKTYLFSVDLEDIRLLIPNGEHYAERVPAMTDHYLEWLRSHSSKCTFFVVGEVAERYPTLIKRIVDEGHEVGCHTDTHRPLDSMTPAEFRDDLRRNVEKLLACGAPAPLGFRAPTFSLTKDTQWAHDILAEEGFLYSSSVLPAKNPLYGWEEFGPEPRVLSSGLVELPMTLGRLGPLRIPFAGGVYFRALPKAWTLHSAARVARRGRPVIGYFHPYDIDTEQERFMHPGINDSAFYNWLMYHNRASMFPRLESLMKRGFSITTHQSLAEKVCTAA